MRRLLLTVLVIVALGGCNLRELTPTSEVIRTRVAGIKADPAEIGYGESTTLSALLVHPPGPRPELGAIWFACLESGSARGCLGFDLSTLGGGELGDDDDSAGPSVDPSALQFGVGETFVYTARGGDVDEAWDALDADDRVEGLSVLVSVTYVERTNEQLEQMLFDFAAAQQADDTDAVAELAAELGSLVESGIPAARRVVISDKSQGSPAPIDCPVDTLAPNANPSIVGVTQHLEPDGRDSGFELGAITFVEPGSELTLRPRGEAGNAEDYLYITTDLETECRREAPWYAWLTNAGTLARDYSFTADEEDLDEIPGRAKVNRLTLPAAEEFPAEAKLWVVVRDRRGGLDWGEVVLRPEGG